MITSRYPIVTFDKILCRVDRRIVLSEAAEYQCVGLKLYGKGAFIRECKVGAAIKRKQQWIVKRGDVIYNKLFAWKGSFAIADEAVDGCIVSDKFPTYSIDTSRVHPEFLALWFRSPHLAMIAQNSSKGAAALSKLTLNPPDFWRLSIPLPDLDEQSRVASRVSRLLQIIERVKEHRSPIDAVVQGRRAGIGSEVRLLMSAALRNLNDAMQHRFGILDDVLTLRPRSGPSFPCAEQGEGIPVIMPSALGGFRLDTSKVLYGFGDERLNQADILHAGDLLISRGNKRDQVGLCVVFNSDGRFTYANLLMRMTVNPAKTLPEFVKYWVMSPVARKYILDHTKGTSPSVQKINQRALINMPFPKDVGLAEQQNWVRHLDTVFNRVDDLELRIRDQHALLESLVPSVLDRAFRGDL